MVPFKYIPPNQALLIERVLRNYIDQTLEFEIIKYGRRDQCNCRVFAVSIRTSAKNEIKLNEYLAHNFVTNIEIFKASDILTYSFEIRYKKIRADFHKMYNPVFPAYSEYFDIQKYPKGEINILLYKRKEAQQINFEVLIDNVCSFSKENSEDIEQALIISRKQRVWEIEGTGCDCCSFNPIEIEKLDKIELSILFRKLQSELDKEGNFNGITSGIYDA